MRRLFFVLLVIAVIVGGVVVHLSFRGRGEGSPQGQDGDSIPPVDTTGNEATPEAYMLAIKNDVENLDKRGEYKMAYNLIDDCLMRHYSLENIQYALEHAEKHLSTLRLHNTITQKTAFVIPEDKNEGKRLAALASVFLLPGLGSVIAAVVESDADWELCERARKQEFTLIEKEVANSIISQYEVARESVKKYLEILIKSYPTGDTEEAKQIFFTTKSRADALKQNLMDARCNYVSYRIISPVLAEVSKEHYIATLLEDKHKIKDSILLLTHAFHTEWLYTSKEDIRLQFCELVKALKDDIGKAEWEELKTVTTLLDSNDPSKPRGAEAWWGK